MSVRNRESLLAIWQLVEAVTGLKLRNEWLGAGSAPLRRKAHKLTGQLSRSGPSPHLPHSIRVIRAPFPSLSPAPPLRGGTSEELTPAPPVCGVYLRFRVR